LLDCVRTLVATVGCRVEDAVATATTTPLRLLGLDPRPETITVTDELELVP
jgi:N-acetylglucosamine-6-phosphate deacetylase